MLLGIMIAALLIALGLCGARTFIMQKIPGSADTLLKLSQAQPYLGLAGFLVGAACGIGWILSLPHMVSVPIAMLISLAAVLLNLGLGLIFGLEFVRSNLKDPSSPFLLKLDAWRAQVLPYQQAMGFAAIAIGVYTLLIHFI